MRARAKPGDRRRRRGFVVADREMVEKVLDGLDVEPGEFCGCRFADALEHGHGRVQPADECWRRWSVCCRLHGSARGEGWVRRSGRYRLWRRGILLRGRWEVDGSSRGWSGRGGRP